MVPNLLDNPSEHVKDVLRLAVVQAEMLGDDFIRSGHLLLALLSTQECTAVIVLSKLGVDHEELGKYVSRSLYREVSQRKFAPLLELSPDTRSSLDSAVVERRALNHIYLTTAHVLLGILRQTDAEAIPEVIEYLESRGITVGDIRAQFSEFYAENRPDSPSVHP